MMSAFREACAYVFSSRNLSWSSCHTIAWYFFSTLFQTKEYYEGTPSAAKSSVRIYDILRKSLKLNICLEMKRKWPLWNFWEKKKRIWVGVTWKARRHSFLLQLLKHPLWIKTLGGFLCFMAMIQLSGFKLLLRTNWSWK